MHCHPERNIEDPEVTQQDLIVYGSLLAVAALAALVIWLSIRTRRRYEQLAADLDAGQVRALAGALLTGQEFLWGTWENTLALRQDQLRIRDQDDREIACVVRYTVAPDGVRREFDWEGRRLQLVTEGGWSPRTVLRERGSKRVLCCCRRRRLQTHYFTGAEEQPRWRIPYTSVFHRYWSIRQGSRETGRFFLLPGVPYFVPVITVQQESLTPLEQIFIMISQ